MIHLAAAILSSSLGGAPAAQSAPLPSAGQVPCGNVAAQGRRSAPSSAGVFEPNLGRWPASVLFHARAGAVHSWLDAAGWSLVLCDPADPERARAWSLRLAWSSPAQRVGLREPVERGLSVIRGCDPAQWESTTLLHRRIVLHELAPGVDLVARAGGETLEYDLEVAPGADPGALEFEWQGHCGLALDERGALAVATPLGELRLPQPWALELGPEGVRAVECSYRLLDESRFVLDVRRADPESALWIDPALHWSTYLGGQYEQSITSLALAANGSVVVAGHTESIDYPTTPGAFLPFYNGGLDAFVSVLSADGAALEHSTLLGGAGDDRVVALGLTSNGRAVVCGDTTSFDFPVTPGAFDTTFGAPSDVFVARLSADFSALEWSTFVGGDSREIVGDMALRPNGAAVVVGATRGAGFPTTPGAYDPTYNGGSFAGDAFALELAPDGGSLHWSTFLGGPSEELAERVALDASGSVFVSGMAYGPGFPTTFGAFDRSFDGWDEPFVTRLDAQGATLIYSTFLGGPQNDSIRTLLARADGALLIGGQTDDPQFPLTPLAHDPVFEGATEGYLALLSPTGDALLHSTFLGGADEDAVTTLHFDAQGRILVGGETLSEDFETTPGAFDRILDASVSGVEYDVFLVRMASDLASFDYATFFGGRNPERLSVARSDAQGRLVLAGTTRGAGFPSTSNAFQPAWNITALSEGFVTKLELLLHPIPYGIPKLNSGGGFATLRWSGFPSVADQGFAVGIDMAMPNAWCTVFSGLAPANAPYCGGRLRVRPPFTRYQRFKTDFFGFGQRAVPLAPWMAGQTLYFQAWYADEEDPFGCGLSDALSVLVHP